MCEVWQINTTLFPGKKTMKRARMLLSIWPCLLLLIWPPWPLSVNSVGVDPPSASNAMSMASSLLQTLTENEFGDPLDGGEDNRRRNRPEMCKVKNLKQQQKMSMAKLDAHRCLIRDVVVQVPVPDTLIATYVHPSHVVVPRCTGKNWMETMQKQFFFDPLSSDLFNWIFFLCLRHPPLWKQKK